MPIVYGPWVMRHREFVLVRVDADDGNAGFAYCLTRDGPVPEIVAKSIAPRYVGASAVEPRAAFFDTLYSNHAVHAAGIGMRSLSVVDIAAWDLACKIDGVTIAAALGVPEPVRLPATAIVGYPPSLGPEAVAAQVAGLWAAGWRRFKVPIAPTSTPPSARLRAARAAAPTGWVGFDANMVFRTADDVARFDARVADLDLGWIEDLVPPGDAALVADCRSGCLDAGGDGRRARRFVPPPGAARPRRRRRPAHRPDDQRRGSLGCHGCSIRPAGPAWPWPRTCTHTCTPVCSRRSAPDVPIEWGVPGTGVHPMDDCLEQPVIVDGLMEPLAQDAGFGHAGQPTLAGHPAGHRPRRPARRPR